MIKQAMRVIHFEIQAHDPERAIKFYRRVFGWNFKKWASEEEDYWLITTGPDKEPGINGGLMRRNTPATSDGANAYVCIISVPSADKIAKKIANNGGIIIMPKTAVPGVGWLVYCKDTESNIFGIIEENKKAK